MMSGSRLTLRFCGGMLLLSLTAAALAGTTTRVSVSSGGAQGNDQSDWAAISADGRYVAFRSYAGTLVAGDTNGGPDVFRHDRLTGATRRVSVTSAGTQVFAPSYDPTITADGRYIAFMATANDLVANDTTWLYNDIALHDCVTGNTSLVNLSTSGAQANDDCYSPSISANGRYLAFVSAATNLAASASAAVGDVFVRDLLAGTTTHVSKSSAGVGGNDYSLEPAISADGRYVAFKSYADNLVAGDTNGAMDVFVHDLSTGTTTRVSVSSSGTQANHDSHEPCLSGDGRYVAFHSTANNLVTGDTNGAMDVFVRDCVTSQTTRVSVNEAGVQSAYDSLRASLTLDGRYVVFGSDSPLVSGDTNQSQDVFMRDRVGNQTTRLSLSSGGTQGNAASGNPVISADGAWVAFTSDASNLVTGDTNGVFDVFATDTGLAPTNSAPSAPTAVSIIPAAPGLQNLYGNASGSTDLDGDTVRYQYWWSRSTDGGTTWEAWQSPGRRLAYTNVRIGEVWRVRARATDGTLFSPWTIGSSVTILSMVASVTPLDGTVDVSQRPYIIVTFRWPVDQASAQSHFRLKRGTTSLAGTFSWPQANRKLKFVPTNKLVAGTPHTVNLLSGIVCSSGRVLNWAETPCTFTTAGAPAVAAVSVAAAPTASGAQVTVNLSSAATVRTVITNIAGRVVAELPERELPAGVSALVWNGRSNTGTKVPAGRYLVRVQAKGDEGAQATGLAALRMR